MIPWHILHLSCCRNAIAILRSYKKNNNGELRIIKAERLARFGFDLIENICKIHNTKIIEVDGEEIPSANKEMTKDLISIITSFSARLYGLRSHKMKNILEAVRE